MKPKIIALLLLTTAICFAQPDTSKALNNAFKQGKLMVEAFQNADYEEFLNYNHPDVIALVGGREKMVELLSKGFGEGVEILKIEIEPPQVLIVENGSYQCVVEQKQYMSIDGERFYFTSSLIGLSYDEGKSWSFLSVSRNTLPKLQNNFPELSNKLKVSPQSPPMPIED